MDGMHFDRMAEAYADARPPYPAALYDLLRAEGVIGRDVRVLEVGAGAGLATQEIVAAGAEVTAVEPGPSLAAVLRRRLSAVRVLEDRLEVADLPGPFDSVVSATAMHWVDLDVGLPRLHQALRPRGLLAVWRMVFRHEGRETPFRRAVRGIVARRPDTGGSGGLGEPRPTMEELTGGGWFEPVRSEGWRSELDLTADQIGRLFRSFSDWTPAEAQEAAAAAQELGGVVTERYRTVLHLLRRAGPVAAVTCGPGARPSSRRTPRL